MNEKKYSALHILISNILMYIWCSIYVCGCTCAVNVDSQDIMHIIKLSPITHTNIHRRSLHMLCMWNVYIHIFTQKITVVGGLHCLTKRMPLITLTIRWYTK